MPVIDLLEKMIWRLRGRHFFGKGRILRMLSPHSGERIIRIADNVRIRLSLADHLQRLMYMDILHHDWFPVLPALLRPGGVFLDVGANIGYFSLLAAGLVGPTGQVLALEPVPRTYELLSANIALNGFTHVKGECRALGASSGSLLLHIPPAEAHRDYLVTGIPMPSWSPIRVPCSTLDELLQNRDLTRIDLLKIDVEGFEPDVIRGGRSALASGRIRAMVCELSGIHLAHSGTTPNNVAKELESLGFQHARVHAHGRISRHPLPHLRTDRDYNLIFVHRESGI